MRESREHGKPGAEKTWNMEYREKVIKGLGNSGFGECRECGKQGLRNTGNREYR